MKLVKRLVIVLGVLGVLLVGGVVLAAVYIDSIAKSAIEKGGTYAMGVPTTVSDVDVGLRSGTFAMRELQIANPAGFTGDHFVRLASGGVAADLGSVRAPVVEVPRLALDGIRVNLERSAAGSNYGVILDNLKRFESGGGATTPDAPSEGDAKKFIVRELVITDVEVRLQLTGLPGDLAAVTVPIHEIRLSNVGSASGGMTAGQITAVVVKAVLESASERGGDLFPPEILGEIRGSLAQLQEIKGLGVEVVGKAGEAAQKLTEGLSRMGADAGEKLDKATDDLRKGAEDALKKLLPGKN
ncbi:MAG: hypothetical protein SFY69_11560 [Planctomycetota bacterium]|nr:hypothetical protein [Planctomycetota bacterium]